VVVLSARSPNDLATTCANHRKRERVAACGTCGSPLCTECIVHTSVGIKCRRCTGVRTTAPLVEGGTGAAPRKRWAVPVAVAGLLVAGVAGVAMLTRDGGSGGGEPEGAVNATAVDRQADLVGAGGLRLGATLTLPAGAGGAPVPGVLIVPGAGSLDRNSLVDPNGGVPNPLYEDVSQAVVGSGMAVLRYDRRGVGTSLLSPDDPLSFDDMVADARAGVDFLAQRREVSGAPIAVVGYDDGGWAAMRVAAEDPRVKALVLISTTGRPLADYLAADFVATDPVRGPELAAGVRALAEDLKAGRVPARDSVPPELRALVPASPTAGSVAYYREVFSFDPVAAARGVTVPTLFLRGGRDTAIVDADVDALRGALGAGFEVVTAPTGDHTIMLPTSHGEVMHQGGDETPRDAEAMTRMSEWLRTRVGG
jgi:pimeloyl-ACP methyl ester carboxylesterase